MSKLEWESLCDGCARCCLNKLIDTETDVVHYTDVACTQLNLKSCRCKNYADRNKLVKTCVVLTPRRVAALEYLPKTCAYRLVQEGKDLYAWHPLKSGDPDSVIKAGISVRGRVVSEDGLTDDEIENRIVKWPHRR